MGVAFWVTTLVVVATPGTGAIYSISAGLARGTRAGVIAAFGCTLGVVPHMIAAVTGLAALLNASASAFQSVKWLGVAYLLYLAVQTWRDRSTFELGTAPNAVPSLRVVRTAVLINLLNPKLTVFFFAFLPQFVPPGHRHPTSRLVALSLVFMAVTFVVFALYGTFAGTMRSRVITRPAVLRRLRRSFAATYLVLAGRLALQTR